MANARFISIENLSDTPTLDITTPERLFPQLPAGTYYPLLAAENTVVVPQLTAGVIDQAAPSVGDTLTTSGSNATGTATYLWQANTGAGFVAAGGTNNNPASYDTTGQPAGSYRLQVIDGVQEAVTAEVAVASISAPAQMGAPSLVVDSTTQITATLAAAPADNGSAITSYDLRWQASGGVWTTVLGITSPHAITGLAASTLHNVQTRAVNANGAAPWSASASATTNAVVVNELTEFSLTDNTTPVQDTFSVVSSVAGTVWMGVYANGTTTAGVAPAAMIAGTDTGQVGSAYNVGTLTEGGADLLDVEVNTAGLTDGTTYFLAVVVDMGAGEYSNVVGGNFVENVVAAFGDTETDFGTADAGASSTVARTITAANLGATMGMKKVILEIESFSGPTGDVLGHSGVTIAGQVATKITGNPTTHPQACVEYWVADVTDTTSGNIEATPRGSYRSFAYRVIQLLGGTVTEFATPDHGAEAASSLTGAVLNGDVLLAGVARFDATNGTQQDTAFTGATAIRQQVTQPAANFTYGKSGRHAVTADNASYTITGTHAGTVTRASMAAVRLRQA